MDLLQHDDPEVRECALLALLRTGQGAWQEFAAGIAADPDHPLSGDAPRLLTFQEAPTTATPLHRAVVRLLDLRWEAARRFGTIDGRPWGLTMLERLGQDDHFLDEVILSAAVEVHQPGVKDHLLSLLLEPGPEVRVRAAVRVLPRELDLLVDAGLWTPETPGEWSAALEEAMEAGVTPLLPTFLSRAAAQPRVAPAAAALLVRVNPAYEAQVLAALDGDDPELKTMACRGVAEAGLVQFGRALQGLVLDEDPGVRAAALVARLQLGEAQAYEEARQALLGTDLTIAAERATLRDALAVAGRSGDLTAFLSDVSEDLDGLERADILAICVLRGRLVDGAVLREAFALCPPDSSEAVRLIEALGKLPTHDDLDFLDDLFPVDQPVALNVALALTLIRSGHKKVEPVLRAAVWSGPLDRSILAAAVVKQASGMNTLQHWVLKPPPGATSADIRRVGYAIGEWGGVEAIQELQARMGGVAGADRPALQGAFMGAMAARTH